jgi:predicted transcriptional regulator
LRIYSLLQNNPFSTAGALVQETDLTAPTVNAVFADFQKLGIIDEVTWRRRIFGYRAYLHILKEGTKTMRPSKTLSDRFLHEA